MPPGDCYRDAAQRSLRDANILMNSGKCGTAYYLYGLAVECALKAAFPAHYNQQSLRHHDLAKLLQELKTAIAGHHNVAAMLPSTLPSPLQNWRNDSRYWSHNALVNMPVSELRYHTVTLCQRLGIHTAP